MTEELDKQVENKPERDEKGRLLPGNTANPDGRPKGKTLKEFAREYLMNQTDEEKLAFLNSLSKDIVWKMAEGNPHQSVETDITTAGLPFQIIVTKDGGENDKTIPKAI